MGRWNQVALNREEGKRREREVRKRVREGTVEVKVFTFQFSFVRFFGAITKGCMRPFVPRTNEHEITTTLSLNLCA